MEDKGEKRIDQQEGRKEDGKDVGVEEKEVPDDEADAILVYWTSGVGTVKVPLCNIVARQGLLSITMNSPECTLHLYSSEQYDGSKMAAY